MAPVIPGSDVVRRQYAAFLKKETTVAFDCLPARIILRYGPKLLPVLLLKPLHHQLIGVVDKL
jgi:hypothetical protein